MNSLLIQVHRTLVFVRIGAVVDKCFVDNTAILRKYDMSTKTTKFLFMSTTIVYYFEKERIHLNNKIEIKAFKKV